MTALTTDFQPGQCAVDAQEGAAGLDQISQRAKGVSMPTHRSRAEITLDGSEAILASTPNSGPPPSVAPAGEWGHTPLDAHDGCAPLSSSLLDPTLALAADILDDLERTKLANENRLRQLTRSEADADGEERGFGLDASHPDVARLSALVQMLADAEHQATLDLQRAMRRHPLGPWVKAQKGIGDKQAARLLAKIGDPAVNATTGQFRTVSALWAYCGLHVISPTGHMTADAHCADAGGGSNSAGGDHSQPAADAQSICVGVAARRQKGIKANWSQDAKMRAWLIVASCIKQLDPRCKRDGVAEHAEGCGCSPYRIVVDERRQHTAVTHPEWTPGHSLNDGMRIASKRLLRDLWREARRIHAEELAAARSAAAPRA